MFEIPSLQPSPIRANPFLNSKIRTLLSIFLLACLAFIAKAQNAASAKPEIVVIVSDNMAYADVGCHGSKEGQTNVLKEAQREILARAKKAKPSNYVAAVKQNKGNGSAYPDGFTVNVESTLDGKKPTLPFPVLVTLTSNPKGIEDYPKGADLNAEMKATVDVEGGFNVIKFTVK